MFRDKEILENLKKLKASVDDLAFNFNIVVCALQDKKIDYYADDKEYIMKNFQIFDEFIKGDKIKKMIKESLKEFKEEMEHPKIKKIEKKK